MKALTTLTMSPATATAMASLKRMAWGEIRRWTDSTAMMQGNHREHHGAGEASEFADLAGAEGEAGVVGVPPGEVICQRP